MSLSICPIHPLLSESGSQEKKTSDCGWNGFSEIGTVEWKSVKWLRVQKRKYIIHTVTSQFTKIKTFYLE